MEFLFFILFLTSCTTSALLHAKITENLIATKRHPDYWDMLLVLVPGVSILVWLALGIKASYKYLSTMQPSTWPQQFFDYPPN